MNMEFEGFNQDRFDYLISELLERELTQSEEEELIKLRATSKEAAAEYATLQALMSVRALNFHETTVGASRAKFLAEAKRQNKLNRPSFFSRLWVWLVKPRTAWGVPIVAAQMGLILVYFQALVPINPQQAPAQPLYRGTMEEVCATYEIRLSDQTDLNSLIRTFSQSGINIVEGPTLQGTFRVNAPGLSAVQFRERTRNLVDEIVELKCGGNQ